MKTEAQKDVTRILKEDRRAVDEALKCGVRKAILRHKKDGLPVASNATARSSG
jgi:Arc/MetJ family transcription regulator